MSDSWHPKFVDFLSQEFKRLAGNYTSDPSFQAAVNSAVSDAHPTPQSVIAAQAAANAQQISQAKPAAKHPWDEWDDSKKAQMDKALETLEGVQLWRRAGGLGIGKQHEQLSNAIAAQGGITPEQATLLARYRMAKNGETDIPTGDRQPDPNETQAELRRQQFFASSQEGRAKMLAEDKAAAQRSLAEGHFDDLVAPAPVPQPPPQEQVPQEAPVPMQPQANAAATPQPGGA